MGTNAHDDFAPAQAPRLRAAVRELSWLLARGYAETAATKLVGDQHQLTAPQRKAVTNAACPAPVARARRSKRVELAQLHHRSLHIDAFNCLIGCESVLSGAPVFRGRDHAVRDIAGVHGAWRRARHTLASLDTVRALLDSAQLASVTWWVDRPVSHSGELAQLLATASWRVEVVDHADPHLAQQTGAVATADGWVLDRAPHWVDLPAALAEGHPHARMLDLA